MNIWNSFYDAVIKDDRWSWYLEGLGKTLLISMGAIAIGVLLGIIVALIKYVNKKFDNFKIGVKICNFYLTIFRGTPVYVQLLIMYLIIFTGILALPTVWVAILTFGINSGAYVAEIIRGGLESVDDGQIEAGRALGLSKLQVMIKIVLPQGFKVALPPLFNEFIALVKETSIVGTIGEVDLTKVADRIIARTFEPFVPYIMIALMYLVVVIVLTKLLKLMERRLAKNERHKS